MSNQTATDDLGIASRIRRSQGRGARTAAAMAKVTREERIELEAAAKRDGKALSEWAREALLDHARNGQSNGAVFTELIALRLLMNGVLRELALGRTMTEQQYQALVTSVRTTKHETAQDVLTQYQPAPAGGR